MHHKHIDKIQRHIRHRHAQHSGDQQLVFPRELHEGDQYQRPHGRRRADNKPSQIALRLIEQAAFSPRAHRSRQRRPENQHQHRQQDGHAQGQRDGGRITDIRLFLGAPPQRSAAYHLDPCCKHAAQRSNHKEDRIRELIRRNRLNSQEPPDHDAVDQKAQRHRQRGQDLRCQHLLRQFTDHLHYSNSSPDSSQQP